MQRAIQPRREDRGRRVIRRRASGAGGCFPPPQRAQRQRLPARDDPRTLPGLGIVEDAGEAPAQLDRGGQLTALLIDGADGSQQCTATRRGHGNPLGRIGLIIDRIAGAVESNPKRRRSDTALLTAIKRTTVIRKPIRVLRLTPGGIYFAGALIPTTRQLDAGKQFRLRCLP